MGYLRLMMVFTLRCGAPRFAVFYALHGHIEIHTFEIIHKIDPDLDVFARTDLRRYHFRVISPI